MARPHNVTCVFCGKRGASSREDVIPKWLARLLALKGRPPYFDVTVEIQGGQLVTTGSRHIGGLPLPYKLPDVCASCNNGWMSDLEEGMKRAGRRLILGEQYLLDPYDQVVIATWMVKTALLYDVARGNQVVPLEDGCRRFYAMGAPLPRSQVMLAAFQPPDGRVLIPHRRKEHKLIDPATGNIVFHAIDVTFMFRYLVIQAFINHQDDAPEIFQSLAPNAALVQCWPVKQPISWQPPLKPLSPPSTVPEPTP